MRYAGICPYEWYQPTLFPPPSPIVPPFSFTISIYPPPEILRTWHHYPLISRNAICRDLPPWTIDPMPPSILSLFSNHPILSSSIYIMWENCKHNHILVWFNKIHKFPSACGELYLSPHIPLHISPSHHIPKTSIAICRFCPSYLIPLTTRQHPTRTSIMWSNPAHAMLGVMIIAHDCPEQ